MLRDEKVGEVVPQTKEIHPKNGKNHHGKKLKKGEGNRL